MRYQTRLYPSLAGTEYVPSRSSIVLRELWSASQLGLRSIGCIPLILQCVIHESCQPYIQYSYRLLVRSTESRQIPQIPAITQLNHHTCLSFSGLFLSFILCIYASPTTIWYKLHTLHYIGVQIRTRIRTIAPDRVQNWCSAVEFIGHVFGYLFGYFWKFWLVLPWYIHIFMTLLVRVESRVESNHYIDR